MAAVPQYQCSILYPVLTAYQQHSTSVETLSVVFFVLPEFPEHPDPKKQRQGAVSKDYHSNKGATDYDQHSSDCPNYSIHCFPDL